MATFKSFEDIDVWQLVRVLCQDIFDTIEGTKLEKDYKLRNQINGSSGSVMDNIAEGFERGGNKEFIQFLHIAKASCGETRLQLYRVLDRKYIDEEKFNVLKNQTLEISNKIETLVSYLKRSDYKRS